MSAPVPRRAAEIAPAVAAPAPRADRPSRGPRLLAWAEAGAEAVSVLLFAAILAICLAGIAWRYLLDDPLYWSDELAMVAFVWATFWTDALVTRERDHVAFDILWDVSGPVARRWTGIAQCALFAGLFAAALPAVVDYVLFLRLERSSALEWRLDLIFSCFILYMASVVVRLLVKLARLCGPGWRALVAPDEAPNTANIVG
ncbi:TRAP transporter small permease subunit [Roseomonas sp. OT10]|uniref:TRAP transporter small permease n=1 Tax=Roseomonas cutis TaxID=2897332 RepID=UPI001E65C168|nr:TRAP transporter small permease subunit [Roseomonas sp. OT10]UFN49686.1 TRAP transporter small permease subunit [Roseomonas sp. OT10]